MEHKSIHLHLLSPHQPTLKRNQSTHIFQVLSQFAHKIYKYISKRIGFGLKQIHLIVDDRELVNDSVCFLWTNLITHTHRVLRVYFTSGCGSSSLIRRRSFIVWLVICGFAEVPLTSSAKQANCEKYLSQSWSLVRSTYTRLTTKCANMAKLQ